MLRPLKVTFLENSPVIDTQSRWAPQKETKKS
jgi:hypothetical protein